MFKAEQARCKPILYKNLRRENDNRNDDDDF